MSSAGLDDSGEKKITVRSEIIRGDDAVFHAALEHFELEVGISSVEMWEPVRENRQAGKDSPGFMLGARYARWKEMSARLEEPNLKYNSEDDIKSCQESVESDFQEIHRLQKELSVDDAALFETLKDPIPNPRYAYFSAWESRQKSKADAEKAKSEMRADALRAELMNKAAAEEQVRIAAIHTHLPQLVTESQARALKAHPDLGKAGSPLNGKFITAYKALQSTNSPRLQTPDWPEKLAAECAADSPSVANR